MTPSRTVIVGSAVPLLIVIGLVGFPPARVALGLERPEPAPFGSNTGPIADPRTGSGTTVGTGRAAEPGEALSLARLRRSIRAGQTLAFTGTEIVSVWHRGSSATRVVDLAQGPDGVRTASARDAGDGEHQVAGHGGNQDALAGLSERALDALAAGYELRTGEPDQVAGRTATVVVAAKGGREVARMWLDDRTGLLLRQDVRDSTGRLHRMAAFVDLRIAEAGPGGGTGATVPAAPLLEPIQAVEAGGLSIPAVRRHGGLPPRLPSAPAPAGVWADVVSPAELTRLRADGWPCPVALPAGYVLLDARRATVSGRSTVHLTYGDGLSAISLFLQRGELDAARLAGLTSQKWGDTEVYVRDGWPEVMVWQGGPTVITAVADAEPSDLQTVLSALPREADHGTLGSLQQRMGSALAWFGS